MKSENHQNFSEICRKIGWKCTSQRLAVYDFLCENRMHPNVDAVWQAVKTTLPSISRESTYRILNEFADNEIIRRIDHIENARYDSRTLPHGHFICKKCGMIFDFDLKEGEHFPQVKIPGTIQYLEFRAVGICEKCIKTTAPIKKGG